MLVSSCRQFSPEMLTLWLLAAYWLSLTCAGWHRRVSWHQAPHTPHTGLATGQWSLSSSPGDGGQWSVHPTAVTCRGYEARMDQWHRGTVGIGSWKECWCLFWGDSMIRQGIRTLLSWLESWQSHLLKLLYEMNKILKFTLLLLFLSVNINSTISLYFVVDLLFFVLFVYSCYDQTN